MTSEKKSIIFTITHEDKEYKMQVERGQHESLMSLISDHLAIPRFGICYGGGSCGTCGVEIKDNSSNERKFTLSCEVKIDDKLANKRVKLL